MPTNRNRPASESATPAATVEDARNSPAPSDPTDAVGEKHLREPDVDVRDPDAAEKASREDIKRPVQGGDVTPAAVAATRRPTPQQLAGEKAVEQARKAEAATARTGGRSQDNRVVPAHPTGGRVSGDRR